MEDNCPYCDCVVTSECKALLCESCNKYVHYLCSELPTYSIMLLLKSQRKFICKSCVLAKYQDFPALPGELDTILATQRRKLSSDSTGPTANMNNAVTQLETQSIKDNTGNHVDTDLTSDTVINISLDDLDLEPSLVTDTHCRYYLQGRCKHGRKGVTCQYSHPKICLRYIKKVERGCNKDKSCKFVHPKLCHKSVSDKLCLRKTCHYYHAVGTIRPNHAGYLNRDGSQNNYGHSNLEGVNSNYQYPENANDDFPNNAEYHDGYLNKDEPHRTYEQSNRQHANQIPSNNLDVLSDENNYRKRRFDKHKVTYDNRYRQNAEISRQNFYETQYDVRHDNNPDNSSFLEQIRELKSQFTEMQTQQQILLESMKCFQNLWAHQVNQNAQVQMSHQIRNNQFPNNQTLNC